MLYVFSGYSSFVVVGLVALGGGAWAFSRTARRFRLPRPGWVGLYAGAVLCAVVLTMSAPGYGGGAAACSLSYGWEPFRSQEGELNVLLFVPVGAFGLLALRRVRVALPAGVLLSAAIEAVQALVPSMGRACDTADLQTNATGTLLGCLLAAAVLAVRRGGSAGAPAAR